MSDEKPAVLMATTGKVSNLADGTVRIVVEIPPTHAKQAFELFCMPGTSVAIALLTNAAALEADRNEVAQAASTDKGPHGKAWSLLYKAGTWFSPELHDRFGLRDSVRQLRETGPDAGPAIVELVKGALYDSYGVDSTTLIDPAEFRADMRAQGIEHILPREF